MTGKTILLLQLQCDTTLRFVICLEKGLFKQINIDYFVRTAIVVTAYKQMTVQ